MRSRGLATALGLSALSLLAGPLVARGELDPADELLLDLWLERWKLVSDEFYGYRQGPAEMFLPLGLLGDLVGLGIQVDVARGTCEGFVLDESRSLRLDVGRSEVTVGDERFSFEPHLVQVADDDIYVEAALLSSWLPMEIEVDRLNSRVHVHPDEPLPMQRRWERERLFRQRAGGNRADPDYPRVDHPYRRWDGPFFDQTLELRASRGREGMEDSKPNHTLQVTGDVFYLGADLRLETSGANRVVSSKFTLERVDPEGAMIPPLGLRRVAFGDFSTTGATLVLSSTSLRGALVSNYPVGDPARFSSHDFVGPLPTGWEVELFHNGVLLDYSVAERDAEYQFLEVPLLYGLNRFHLKFYGPEGQRVTEDHRFHVGRGLVRPREHLFRLGGGVDGHRRRHFVLDYRRGLNRSVSLDAGLYTVRPAPLEPVLDDVDGRPQDVGSFAKAGVHASWRRFYGGLDLATSFGGSAAEAQLQTRVGSWNFVVRHTELSNYASPAYRAETNRGPRITELRTDGRLARSGALARIPVGFRAQLRHDRTEWHGRVSFSRRRASIVYETDWRTPRHGSSVVKRGSGRLHLRTRIGKQPVRSSAEYEFAPGVGLRKVGAHSDRLLGNGYYLRAGVVWNFALGDREYEASLNRDFGKVALGFGGNYSDAGRYLFGLRISTAIAHNARRGEWYLGGRSSAKHGAASALVFLDRNQNGRLDFGDETLEDVGFRIDGAPLQESTRADGTAFIPSLPAHRATDLSLIVDDLDPYWLPNREGVRFVPRPGSVVRAEFPVLVTGEIDGTVEIASVIGPRPLPGLRVELVDSRGVAVQKVRTGFDGFYLLEKVPPGEYEVRLDGETVARRGYRVPQPHQVVVTRDGSVESGVDFFVEYPVPRPAKRGWGTVDTRSPRPERR